MLTTIRYAELGPTITDDDMSVIAASDRLDLQSFLADVTEAGFFTPIEAARGAIRIAAFADLKNPVDQMEAQCEMRANIQTIVSLRRAQKGN